MNVKKEKITSAHVGERRRNPRCMICGAPVPGYEPQMCCDGYMCACRGMPVEPCVCGRDCDNALYGYIGLPMDERRRRAGIVRWIDRPGNALAHQRTE